MATDRFSDGVAKAVWQGQSVDALSLPIEELRKRAQRFQSIVHRRNLIEYIACVFVVAIQVWMAFDNPYGTMKIAHVVTALGVLIVAWQLHRRASSRTPPADAMSATLIGFHRAELVRQRDALNSVWLWYLGPFIPGIILMGLARWFQAHNPYRTIAGDHLAILLGGAIVALIFMGVWLLNHFGAKRLQKMIDEIDRVGG